LRYFLFILLVFCSISLFANNDVLNTFNTGYYLTSQDDISISEIKGENFTHLSGAILGFNTSTHWFKVTLPSELKNKNVAFLLNETVVDAIEIYIGEEKVFEQSGHIEVNPIIKNIDLQGKPIYFKVKFHSHVYFDLQIVDSSEIDAKEDYILFGNGWYYGFVFMVFIVNLFFYFSLKNEPFLSYALFVAAINVGISFYDGVLGFWFDFSQIDALVPLNHFLIGLTGCWFATGFLNLNRLFPKAKIVGYASLGLSALLYGAFMITNSYFIIAIADLLIFLLLMFYWVMGIVVIKRQQFAIFFVVGYVLVLLAGFFHVAPMNFGIHVFPIQIGIVKIGAVFEMLILTYAITYKVKIMQEENNSMKDELKNYIAKLLSFEERLSLGDSTTNPGEAVSNKIEKLAKEFDLTDREVDVLLCIANQSTNSKIAEELFISVNTVKYHTRNIYQKLNIKSKGDAISLLSNPV
jgi:DNA-binding CsgD family transcriptional regulator